MPNKIVIFHDRSKHVEHGEWRHSLAFHERSIDLMQDSKQSGVVNAR